MALNVSTSINIANPWSTVLTTRIVETFLKVFEPNLLFWKYSEAPISEEGYSSVTWVRPNRLELIPSQALMSPWVTPVAVLPTLDSITVTAKQYGLYSILSDEVLSRLQGRNLPAVVSDLVSANLARIIDRVIQDEVLDNATNVFYASTTSGWARAANRAALTAANKVFAFDLIDATRRLEANFSPYLNGEYICLMATNVAMYLQTETGVGGFIDIQKFSRPDRIEEGTLGKVGNMRIIKSPFVKSYTSTTKVYPTLFIGKQAYGASQLQAMQLIVKPLGSSGTEDPLNQRMTVGVKVSFAAKILQQASIRKLESAGIDSI